MVKDNKVYITCHMAKFTRLPYTVSSHKSSLICEMIHMDIWGSYRVHTHKGYRYILTLVDDCTRTRWVYLLKHKSQALSTFQKFMKFISTQFQATIKVVKSDNLLEFHSDPCQKIFTDIGVLH